MKSVNDMRKFLNSKSVSLVGASENQSKFRGRIAPRTSGFGIWCVADGAFSCATKNVPLFLERTRSEE